MSLQRDSPRLDGPFRIGDRLVIPTANEIDGVRVDSKAMEVLVALAAATPAVVSASALLERIWSDVVVVDNVVYQAIAQLRKILGDDARAPRYIETVPRRGYRVIATVVSEASQKPSDNEVSTVRRRHNLPAQLTSFIGRERDVIEIGGLLAAHRLVTLTGVGGCGKTRLALAVANARLDDFDDGAWLVELAPVTDPTQVETTVARALGVRAAVGESLRERILETVADRRMLLLLDNCEHLIGPCAELAEAMLRYTPDLRILATSREALGIGGEQPWRIESLATPDPQHLPPLEQLGEIESVRLFTERAAVTQPGFKLTVENVPSVARICCRLDGLPLAIELAAARTRAMSVEQIAGRLAESFRLLTGGSRTALLRQQTLQATLDWSYRLLTDAERVLLRRLAVFAGTFTLEAVEAVGEGEPLASGDITDLLTRLVDQSTTGGDVRYRLLETIRHYGLERLAESREEACVRDRHRDFFVTFCTELAREMRVGSRGGGLFVRFEGEADNLELALAWCLENDAEKGLQLAVVRYAIAMAKGDWDTRWLETFVARTSESAPARHRALFHLAMADVDLPRSRDRLEQALILARRAGDHTSEARYLANLGGTLFAMGEDGQSLLEAALTLARDTGDANTLGWCLLSVVGVGNPKFLERARECIAAFRRANNDVGLAIALHRFCTEGLFLEAQVTVPRECVDELLSLARAQANTVLIADGLLCLALLFEREGELRQAALLAKQSADLLSKHKFAYRAAYEYARLMWRIGDARGQEILRDYLRGGLSAPAIVVPGFVNATTRHLIFALGLLGWALAEAARGRYALAARLYGASLNFREKERIGILATEKPDHDAIVPRIRAALGGAGWAGLYAEGAAMTLERATAIALSNESDGPSAAH